MLASLAWASAFKLDHVAQLCHVNRWVSQEPVFEWVNRSYKNKGLAILFTEVINFGVHGVTNPASVLFACGSTIVNGFMIFIGLPIRQKARREKGYL